CELCAWACPADAIYVEGGDNTAEARYSPGERYATVYQINYARCIFCGLCIEACPTRSLTMSNEYELARDSRRDLIFTKEQLLAPGVFYVLQAGPFIGMVQIIVYTGAIIMLFLFVLMLVGRDSSDALIETLRGQRTAAIVLGIGFAGLVGTALYRGLENMPTNGLDEANTNGNVQGIAALLFTKY